ncbi:hypothetical protein CRYUN_Cryun04dG0195100 [Craigia yunnanensis]
MDEAGPSWPVFYVVLGIVSSSWEAKLQAMQQQSCSGTSTDEQFLGSNFIRRVSKIITKNICCSCSLRLLEYLWHQLSTGNEKCSFKTTTLIGVKYTSGLQPLCWFISKT